MSADTFTTAMFLITAVISAGVLVNAVFPVVYNMAGTFSSASHDSDQRLRTDFKIIAYTASGATGKVWIKNIGSTRISAADIIRSDVLGGATGDFDRLAYDVTQAEIPPEGSWNAELSDLSPTNNNWDPGETVKVAFTTSKLPSPTGQDVYFQFILPNGVWRSVNFPES
jgi:archaeal flagellar protein FlaG